MSVLFEITLIMVTCVKWGRSYETHEQMEFTISPHPPSPVDTQEIETIRSQPDSCRIKGSPQFNTRPLHQGDQRSLVNTANSACLSKHGKPIGFEPDEELKFASFKCPVVSFYARGTMFLRAGWKTTEIKGQHLRKFVMDSE